MPTWDPGQYARIGDERARPFIDLVNRIGASAPQVVVDLGCGNGPATMVLAERWPDARIIGVDNSEAMIEAATAHDVDGRVEWVLGDLATWDPDRWNWLKRPARRRVMRLYYRAKGIVLHDRLLCGESVLREQMP